MHALIDISKLILEESTFDHADASPRNASLAVGAERLRMAALSRPNGGLSLVGTRATARVVCVNEEVRSPRSHRKSGRRVVDLVQCWPLYHRCTIVAEILDCLKKHGQRLDAELAKETGVPLAKVRQYLADIVATGAIVTCSLTRFEQGKRIDGMLYRMSGWVPPPAPGRKAKPSA